MSSFPSCSHDGVKPADVDAGSRSRAESPLFFRFIASEASFFFLGSVNGAHIIYTFISSVNLGY